MRTTRRARWLSGVTALALTGAALAACGDNSDPGADPGADPDGPSSSSTPTQAHSHGPVKGQRQPVAGPGANAGVDLSQPLGGRPISTAERPNLLMITLDDATVADLTHMPHLQRLVVDQGMTLTNGMAPTPICTPARGSLLSGQYAGNHGAVTINGEGGGFSAFEDANTLPVWLQRAGYHTGFIGKYLNDYGRDGTGHYIPPGWSDWRATLDPSTYSFTRTRFNENGTLVKYDRYITDVDRDQSIDMIESAAQQDKPWFQWVNYVAPHHGGQPAPDDPRTLFPNDPRPVKDTTPAPEDVDTFSDLPLPKKPNMFEDTSDKSMVKKSFQTTWPPQRRSQLREAHQQRVEALQSVDRAIRDTFEALRRTGELSSTYIVVTSDNGYTLGEHNLDGKLWYFREDVNVPMFIRGPGLKPGSTSAAPVTNADWAPTFAALAGVKPGRDVDGTNVLPFLRTPASARVVPIAAYPVKGGLEPLYSGIVAGPWTYVEGRHGKAELYYRKVDPWETTNLIGDPRYQKYRIRLKQLAHQYVDCAGSECPTDFYGGGSVA